jgi:hypothetical protein
MTEYRICWNASSNIGFRGATDWEPWEEGDNPEEVLYESEIQVPINLPPGLEIALEASGFEWHVESRENEAD